MSLSVDGGFKVKPGVACEGALAVLAGRCRDSGAFGAGRTLISAKASPNGTFLGHAFCAVATETGIASAITPTTIGGVGVQIHAQSSTE